MPELDYEVENVEPGPHAAAPTLNFRLAIRQSEPLAISTIALQCQIRIEARQRYYGPREKERMKDLFGEPALWDRSLHSMLWTHVQITVPSFDEECQVIMPVPCSFDFNVATTKYFHGLEANSVPLLLLFSGSVFYRNRQGELTMDPIPQNKEASYRMPVEVWQAMMNRYYPDSAWLRLDREVFESLYEYKRSRGFTGFDEALGSLLSVALEAPAP